MSLKYTCDMCDQEVEKYVRVGRDLQCTSKDIGWTKRTGKRFMT